MRLLSKPFPPRAGGFLALVMIVLLTFPATQPLHAKTLSTTAPTLAPLKPRRSRSAFPGTPNNGRKANGKRTSH